MSRELTRDERRDIRKLVAGLCANYDAGYCLCLPLDCPCYMLGKWWTGCLCRYFAAAVLPTDPLLNASLQNETPDSLRLCAVCGRAFIPEGKEVYCSAVCQDEGNRRKSRARMQKMRAKPRARRYD